MKLTDEENRRLEAGHLSGNPRKSRGFSQIVFPDRVEHVERDGGAVEGADTVRDTTGDAPDVARAEPAGHAADGELEPPFEEDAHLLVGMGVLGHDGPGREVHDREHERARPNQYETCELLSKMTGTQTIQKATYNFSGKRNAPVMNHINASVENVERPLMTPDEVSRLKPAKKSGKGDAERIIAPGHMLIFVSGQHPILGTQMLYFLDPRLKAWSEIPPPAKLVSIQGGQIVPLVETMKVNRSTKKSGRQPENAELLDRNGESVH